MSTASPDDGGRRTAFVLGGGGRLGAHEVGMLRALIEHGVRADVVVGTSVGAVNGAAYAADPTDDAIWRLRELWSSGAARIFGDSIAASAGLFAKSTTHLMRNDRLRDVLSDLVPATFEELAVPFECVAAEIASASARYFGSGPLVEALMASAAVPGVFRPVEIDGRHHLDGGLVNSLPLDRALELGATEVFVIQVNRVDEPLEVPSTAWDVAATAFEISRRNRFVEALAARPDDVRVHVLPLGEPIPPGPGSPVGSVDVRIEQSYRASTRYLAALGREAPT